MEKIYNDLIIINLYELKNIKTEKTTLSQYLICLKKSKMQTKIGEFQNLF